jgi:N-acetylglucosaminyl-diphospho-decaprenol L-rhamnosyltransferase
MAERDVLRRVSLITVIYHERDLIAACVRSAQASAERAGVDLEVILVDNAPGDGTAEAALEAAPDAIVISNAENVGFARACNQGFEIATGGWWLLLNPDASLAPGALSELVGFAASHPRAGAVGPAMSGAGRDQAESAGMQPGLRSAMGHFLLVNRLLPGDRGGPWRGIQLHRRPELGPRPVEWASGGAVLLRPKAIREIGGFDPSFFLYADDVDLGARLVAAEWEVWLVPGAGAEHSVAATSGGVTDRWLVALHEYYARSAPRLSVLAFDLIAALGLGIRALAASRDRLHRRRMSVAARAALSLAGRTVLGRG